MPRRLWTNASQCSRCRGSVAWSCLASFPSLCVAEILTGQQKHTSSRSLSTNGEKNGSWTWKDEPKSPFGPGGPIVLFIEGIVMEHNPAFSPLLLRQFALLYKKDCLTWRCSKANSIEAGPQKAVCEIQLHLIRGSIYTAFFIGGRNEEKADCFSWQATVFQAVRLVEKQRSQTSISYCWIQTWQRVRLIHFTQPSISLVVSR